MTRNLALIGLIAGGAVACDHAPAFETDTGTDADADADGDSDSDSDSDTDGETDSSTGSDTGTAAETIVQDCSACPGVGGALEHMACAIDLCDPEVLLAQTLTTPCTFTGCALEDTYEAVARFGDVTNDLEPQLNGSYVLLAAGIATGTSHTTSCAGDCQAEDPWDPAHDANDVVEWRLVLRAPDQAEAFRFRFVFFSVEYDEYVDASYDDKFYAVLEAGSTNGGNATVIDFGPCREGATPDFTGGECDAPDSECCYLSPHSAFSECCYYNGCPDGTWTTDIAGTGYSCATSETSDSSTTGSSTGWLQTAWPIDGGETFAITFHVHDTSDGTYDSQVVLDAFEFLLGPEKGTVRVE